MRLMAIGTGDTGGEHPALPEGAVVVDLVLHLAVGRIEPLGQRRDGMRVREPLAGNPILGKCAAPGVAEAAGLDFLAQQRWRGTAVRVAGRRIGLPGDAVAFVELNQQALGRVGGTSEPPPVLRLPRPIDMPRSLAVAGLAADADLRPGRRETVACRIVVLADAGRVALRAHVVPVLVQPGPMQDIGMADILAGIEVEPALAARRPRAAVPGDRQRLQPAVGELHQVLLQGIDAEGVFDLEGGEPSVRAIGLDQEFSILAEEAGSDAVIVEMRVAEVAEHGRIGGVVHGVPVLRRLPQPELGAMTIRTGRAADEGGRAGRGVRGKGAPRSAAGMVEGEATQHDGCGDHQSEDPEEAPWNRLGRRIVGGRPPCLPVGDVLDVRFLGSIPGGRLPASARQRERPLSNRIASNRRPSPGI